MEPELGGNVSRINRRQPSHTKQACDVLHLRHLSYSGAIDRTRDKHDEKLTELKAHYELDPE